MDNIDLSKALERKKILRKIYLKKLIQYILSNKIDNLEQPKNELYNENPSRQSYLSPSDRSTYNYGYMNINEMGAGSPTVW